MSEKFHNDEFDWKDYYTAVSDKPPRETLIAALELYQNENADTEKLFAVDLGCGSGRDTFELLKNGWKVYATDREQAAIDIIRKNLPERYRHKLTTVVSAFENIVIPKADLINASYSLPFCLPLCFDKLWMKIDNAIVKGGRFAGVFFGMNDEWAKFGDMTFLERNKIEFMFKNFRIEYFHEKDEMGETAIGEKKHWHVYSVIAKKR